jgi:hypothetical protein
MEKLIHICVQNMETRKSIYEETQNVNPAATCFVFLQFPVRILADADHRDGSLSFYIQILKKTT